MHVHFYNKCCSFPKKTVGSFLSIHFEAALDLGVSVEQSVSEQLHNIGTAS